MSFVPFQRKAGESYQWHVKPVCGRKKWSKWARRRGL